MHKFHRITLLPPQNVIAELHKLRTEADARGHKIIDFGMGDPDQPPASHIIDSLCNHGHQAEAYRYTPSRGIKPLRQAICQWYDDNYDVKLNPNSQTVVTIGSQEGLAHLALAITNQGDTAIVPAPFYPIHAYGFIFAGANIAHVALDNLNTFCASVEKLMKVIFPKPKFLILSFPCNPTTQCVELDFFCDVVNLAKKHNLWIIHDFAYAKLAFDGIEPPSILQVPGALEVAVESYSLSKTYNMAGLRIGFMSGNEHLIAALTQIKAYLDYGIFLPAQSAAVSALTGTQECVTITRQLYQRRRDLLCQYLKKNAGWEVAKSAATLYLWAPLPESHRNMGSLEFSKLLLTQAKTSVAPGICFGTAGENFVRFSLLQDEENIIKATKAIGAVLGHKI